VPTKLLHLSLDVAEWQSLHTLNSKRVTPTGPCERSAQLLPVSAASNRADRPLTRHSVIAGDRVNHCLRSSSSPDADEIDQNIILRRLLADCGSTWPASRPPSSLRHSMFITHTPTLSSTVIAITSLTLLTVKTTCRKHEYSESVYLR